MTLELQEATKEFLIETHESLAQLDLDLVTLEKDPTERATLAQVFRSLHTLKGSAGFLGLQKLQGVAHAAEILLSKLRAGELIFNPEIVTAMLAVVDAVRKMLASVEANETDGTDDFQELIGTLDRLRNAGTSAPAPAAPKPRATAPAVTPQASVTFAEATPIESAESKASAISDSSIRVDVGLLDKLMNLVGELVLARNQIVQSSASQESPELLGTVQRLNQLTTELQAGVMKTRMQPIGGVWSKFPRVVRDLAVACGKKARIDMEGQETELDKTIIEAIRDPLTHLIRNAVDHGLETPDRRVACGKDPEGRLAIHAFHEGGKVNIEIADDGAGIDPRRIRDKAVAARLLTSEQADRLSERELVNLIFLPGFSTADKVTQFSGRGVGMDVVRINIEKIGGSVAIESRPGKGTTVRMKIPLTLAIIPALTVSCAGDRYAIPQVSLLELVRLEGEQATRGIEWIHGAAVYRLRGNLLPLVPLDRQLHPDRQFPAATNSELTIVVLQADDRQFGLIVDAIHDTEEIVVKPLQPQLKGINAFAGATIMGDGKVALILDVLGLAQRAHVVSGVRERALIEKSAAAAEPKAERQTVLLFSTRDGGRMGMRISQVARLEEFPRSALEGVGSNRVVQYRGEILPLIDVERALAAEKPRSAGRRIRSQNLADGLENEVIQVVVCTGVEQVGLVVDRIIDIAEEAIVTRSRASRPGILFTAVIQGKVTEFLDVAAIAHAAHENLPLLTASTEG